MWVPISPRRPGSCWQDGSDGQHLWQMLCPSWGTRGVSLAILLLLRSQWIRGSPQPDLLCGEILVPGPSPCRPATSPPAAVDSQAPTSSPRAEPEMLLQARLKCTKCSTCKICSVRK